ncbi:MAG TPA: hypothetical protein VF876_09045 [Burkholderiales bacterium]
MARYLIEVPHEANLVACTHAVQVFLKTGSHFLTHADFGCADGDHKAWLTVDVDSREEARRILPPPLRARARVVKLIKFSLTHYGALLQDHLQEAAGREAARAAA